MKTISKLVAVAALATAVAAPVAAEQKKIEADPFVSTQNEMNGLLIAGGMGFVFLVAASQTN